MARDFDLPGSERLIWAIGHLGVEPFPQKWARNAVFEKFVRWIIPCAAPQDIRHNFGFYTLIWIDCLELCAQIMRRKLWKSGKLGAAIDSKASAQPNNLSEPAGRCCVLAGRWMPLQVLTGGSSSTQTEADVACTALLSRVPTRGW